MTVEIIQFQMKFHVLGSVFERTVSSHFIEAFYDKVVTNTAQHPKGYLGESEIC